jgi:hypothetical protein
MARAIAKYEESRDASNKCFAELVRAGRVL